MGGGKTQGSSVQSHVDNKPLLSWVLGEVITLQDTQGEMRAGDLQGQLQELICSAAHCGWIQGTHSHHQLSPVKPRQAADRIDFHIRGIRDIEKNYSN